MIMHCTVFLYRESTSPWSVPSVKPLDSSRSSSAAGVSGTPRSKSVSTPMPTSTSCSVQGEKARWLGEDDGEGFGTSGNMLLQAGAMQSCFAPPPALRHGRPPPPGPRGAPAASQKT